MLWNRNFTLKPLIADDHALQLKNNSRFSAQAAILKIFLDKISPENNWGDRLHQLIEEHSEIDVWKMGFKKEWCQDPFWVS